MVRPMDILTVVDTLTQEDNAGIAWEDIAVVAVTVIAVWMANGNVKCTKRIGRCKNRPFLYLTVTFFELTVIL